MIMTMNNNPSPKSTINRHLLQQRKPTNATFYMEILPFLRTVPYRKKSQMKSVASVCLSLILVSSVAFTSDAQLSSNIIQLNSRNWKQLEKSPHTWFVNFCRAG